MGSRSSEAEVTKAYCWALGEGLAVTRREVRADLEAWRVRAGLAPAPAAPAAPAEPAPAAPTPAPPLRLVHPDRALTLAEAAARLGATEATVRRYLAPSAGRLARLDGGVSAASVTAYEARRAEAIRRTRWVSAAALTAA
jgi:hypothetical protein